MREKIKTSREKQCANCCRDFRGKCGIYGHKTISDQHCKYWKRHVDKRWKRVCKRIIGMDLGHGEDTCVIRFIKLDDEGVKELNRYLNNDSNSTQELISEEKLRKTLKSSIEPFKGRKNTKEVRRSILARAKDAVMGLILRGVSTEND